LNHPWCCEQQMVLTLSC